MIEGLYHQLHLLGLRIAVKPPLTRDPRLNHEQELSHGEAVKQREDVAAAIIEQEGFERELQGMINRMTITPHKSANLTLALRHLEDAQDRVRRSLGSKPPVVTDRQVGPR